MEARFFFLLEGGSCGETGAGRTRSGTPERVIKNTTKRNVRDGIPADGCGREGIDAGSVEPLLAILPALMLSLFSSRLPEPGHVRLVVGVPDASPGAPAGSAGQVTEFRRLLEVSRTQIARTHGFIPISRTRLEPNSNRRRPSRQHSADCCCGVDHIYSSGTGRGHRGEGGAFGPIA